MMSINRQQIQDSNNRIFVSSKDPYLIDHFLKQLVDYYPDYKKAICYSIDEFQNILQREDIFGNEKHIIILSDMTAEDLPVIDEIPVYDTPDILVFIERDMLPRSKAYTKLKGNALFLKLESPDEKECISWVNRGLREKGFRFSEDVPKFIVKKRGPDLLGLHNEIKKLEYVCHNKLLDIALCDRVVSYGGESQFFILMDNFFRRRIKETIAEFKRVDETIYVKLLHFMIGQVERVYKVSIYRDQKLDDDSIADIIGVPKFILKTKFYTVLASFGKVKLLGLFDLLNTLDLELRSSKYPKNILFESYLLKAMHL